MSFATIQIEQPVGFEVVGWGQLQDGDYYYHPSGHGVQPYISGHLRFKTIRLRPNADVKVPVQVQVKIKEPKGYRVVGYGPLVEGDGYFRPRGGVDTAIDFNGRWIGVRLQKIKKGDEYA